MNISRKRFYMFSVGTAVSGCLGVLLAACGGPSTPIPTKEDTVVYAPPKEVRSSGGILSTDLRVAYANYQIGDAAVYLRSYNGSPVGPTLRARPGDTLKIKLINDLPATADSPAANSGDPHSGHNNMPHGFNLTNLHTHGLWVSPAAVSDNVLLTIHPQETFDFEIAIPTDHPPGTHWYHSHLHGSTALQVSSGMAGMIIVEGGLDDVPEIKQATEQVFVFQQVAYDSNDCGDVLPAELKGKNVGCIESYDNFGLGAWAKLGRSTTVNGQLNPTLKVRPGEVLRWRMAHAGVRESIHLALIRESADGTLPPILPPNVDGPLDLGALVGKGLEVVPVNVIAEDGIAYGRIEARNSFQLEPGYRVDMLVQAPKSGTYRLVDLPADPVEALHPESERLALLARIVIEGDAVNGILPTSDSLSSLAPYPHVEDTELAGCQQVQFNISGSSYTVNGKSYDPTAPACKVPLDKAQEWHLSTLTANHPFHIHVNPFEVQRSDGPNLWKDTYLVRRDLPIGPAPTTVVRTRYRRHTGTFVLHCHILDHEDQGMMEAVEVMDNPPAPGSPDTLCVACP